jgi:hypothetical protein
MPIDSINLGPVSPISNPDIIIGNAGDTKIITGGGSLSSTLTVGDNGGNLDLVKVIKVGIHDVMHIKCLRQKIKKYNKDS